MRRGHTFTSGDCQTIAATGLLTYLNSLSHQKRGVVLTSLHSNNFLEKQESCIPSSTNSPSKIQARLSAIFINTLKHSCDLILFWSYYLFLLYPFYFVVHHVLYGLMFLHFYSCSYCNIIPDLYLFSFPPYLDSLIFILKFMIFA